MQYLIATTSEVVHLIALRAVHSIPLQEVHLSRYWHQGVLPLSDTWYVFAILFFYLIFWLSYRCLPPRARLFGIIAGSAFYIVALRLLNFAQCWYISALGFATGTALAESGFKFERVRSDIVLLAASVMAGGAFFLLGSSWSYQLCYIFIPVAFASAVSMLPLDIINVRFVKLLGRISYSIYLCQMIVIQPIWGEEWFCAGSLLLKLLLSYAAIIVLALFIAMTSSKIIDLYGRDRFCKS